VTRTPVRTTFAAVGAFLLLFAAACGSDSAKTSASSGSSSSAAGATFSFKPLDVGGPLTKAALEKGDIDVGVLFSSDGAIAKNGWVALEDDKKLQPVDNFVAAIIKAKADATTLGVLDAVDAKLTKASLQKMVSDVSIDGKNPEDVAKAFLATAALPQATVTSSFVVGSATFAESEIAAQLYGQALKAAGATVTFKLDFASREAYLPALESGQIDIVPEFVGTLDTFLGGTATNDLDATLAQAKTAAEAKGFTLNQPADADSVNTLVVTKDTAVKYKLTTTSDLKSVTDPLKFGGPPECPQRPYCLAGLKSTYGLSFNV
jgi:osmoprotectant transport system substrate-binding protein